MPTLLYISISPRGDYSISRRLGNAAVEAWKARNPKGRVIERDLTRTPLTFVDLDWIAGAFLYPNTTTRTIREHLNSRMNWWRKSRQPMKSRAAIDEIFSTRQSERAFDHGRSNCSATF
jgi:Flavodoxin-like fold